MKKAIIKYFLLSMMYSVLFIGCGQNDSDEEQLSDVSDHAAAAVSDNTYESLSETIETNDAMGNVERNDTSNEDRSENVECTVQSAIMEGDFSAITDAESRERVVEQYQIWEDNGTMEEMEWRQIDLNGDGIDDLILQECQNVPPTQMHRIVAIFACKEDGAECVLWDLNDGTEYSFCGSTGELMYTAPYFGTSIAGEPYRHYYFDIDWNEITDFRMVRTIVDSSVDGSREEFLQYQQEFVEAHPDMLEDGEYYSFYEIDVETGIEGEREALSYGQFKELFEEIMGIQYLPE